MSLHYYKSIVDLQGITEGRPMPTCDLGESISQVLFMLITTRCGEMPGDPDFGCAIWDLQFEIVVDPTKWKNTVEKSILEGIARYEPRLEQANVQIQLQDVETTYPHRRHPEIKKQANILVGARLRHTQESFSFQTKLYVSPLST